MHTTIYPWRSSITGAIFLVTRRPPLVLSVLYIPLNCDFTLCPSATTLLPLLRTLPLPPLDGGIPHSQTALTSQPITIAQPISTPHPDLIAQTISTLCPLLGERQVTAGGLVERVSTLTHIPYLLTSFTIHLTSYIYPLPFNLLTYLPAPY